MEWKITLGSVDDNKDPAKAGRIKVKLPEMDDGQYPEWVNPILPGIWFTIPNIGETVLVLRPDDDDIVEFASEVFYFGRILDQDHAAEPEHRKNYPNRHGFKTKNGHVIVVDDSKTSPEITLAHNGILLFSLTAQGMFLGSQDSDEPLVCGNLLKSAMSDILGALLTHTHPTGTGPSGPPLPPEFTTFTNLKASVDAGDQLSLFAFTQRAKPTAKAKLS